MKYNKYKESELINYYDIIIDINSFRHLVKENNNNNWGWNVHINKNFNYVRAIKHDNISIGVLGNKNTGKSFILSKISNFNLPTGYSINTKGISVKYPNREGEYTKNIVIFDTVGFNRQLKGINEYKLEDIKHSLEDINIINEIERDRTITEYFIQKFIFKYSNVIIIVVNQLSFSEQQLLIQIKNENKSKRIYVVHNLYNLVTIEQVKDYINNTLLKSLTFKLTQSKFVSFSSYNEKEEKENQYYYHEELGEQSIDHLILGKEGYESGNYYNNTTLNYIRANVAAQGRVKKVPIIQNIIKHLSAMSNFIFEYPVPKDKIKYENNKIFVEDFDKPIILKKINTSCPISSNVSFHPNYNFYVVESYKDISQLENIKIEYNDYSEIRSINDLEGKPIYVLQIELPGLIKYEDKPRFKEYVSEGRIYITFNGVKKMNKTERIKEEEKKHLYTNTREEGKYELYLKLSNDIVSIENSYIGSTYEEGLYTFYYYERAYEDLDFLLI